MASEFPSECLQILVYNVLWDFCQAQSTKQLSYEQYKNHIHFRVNSVFIFIYIYMYTLIFASVCVGVSWEEFNYCSLFLWLKCIVTEHHGRLYLRFFKRLGSYFDYRFYVAIINTVDSCFFCKYFLI